MNAQDILKQCAIEGNIVKLPDLKLDRDLYLEVKKKLELIGGKWKGGKTQGFVFDDDPTQLLEDTAGGEDRNLKKEYQFFATPAELARKMVEMVEIKPHYKVLEPSAGDGALIRAIHEAHPDLVVDCFELMDINITRLKKLPNINFLGTDFIAAVQLLAVADDPFGIYQAYDVIFANPPFTKNQDVEHIYAMWECLKPGGTLITIASVSWLTGTQTKQRKFREWLNEIGYYREELEAGTFKESGTNVRTCLLCIQKTPPQPKENVSNAIILAPKSDVTVIEDAEYFSEVEAEELLEELEAPSTMPKSETRTLRYDFSIDEINAFALQLARETQHRTEVEEEKKQVMAGYNAQIKEISNKCTTLSKCINDGWEERDVECDIEYHQPTRGQKTLRRRDNGKILVEKMQQWEWNLFNQPEETEEVLR